MQHEGAPIDVVPLLDVLRGLTGMDVAYVSEFRHGRQVTLTVSGDGEAVGSREGKSDDLEDTFCQRVVDGRLPGLVADVPADPVCAPLLEGRARPLGAYVAAPLRTAGGRLHGSLCLLAATPRPQLGRAHLEQVEAFALVLGRALAAEEERAAAEGEHVRVADDARHVLRTPVMAMRFLTEDLATGAVDLQHATQALAGEATELTSLLDGLGGEREAPPAVLGDVTELARRAADEAAARLGAAGRVDVRLDAGILPATLDVDAVLRALRDLVDNALRHTGADGRVEVRVERDGPTALVTVTDHGPGIAPEHLEDIRDGFARAGRAVDADIRGIGFGLAGAQRVAEAHEGTLSFASPPGAGASVALRLPLR